MLCLLRVLHRQIVPHVAAFLLTLVGMVYPAGAATNCSIYAGNTSGSVTSKIAINEYNYSSAKYIEVKIKDPSLLTDTNNLQGWRLTFQNSATKPPGFDVQAALNAPSCQSAPSTYLRFNVSGSMGNDAVVVLWDADGKEVDYFRVGQSSYPTYQPSTCFAASEFPAASTQTYHQAALQGSSAYKDLARGPDGSGVWLVTPYNGSDQGTPCASNDGTLAITKTAAASSLWIGQTVDFHVAVTLDARASGQTNVQVNDLLPSWFALIGAPLVSTGTYNATNGVWTIGSLAPGGTATLDLTAKATQTGFLTNSASVQSDTFPAGTVAPATATVNALVPTLTNVANPTTVAVNGQTSFTITVANPSGSLAAPAFNVTNVLDSAGLTLVSATPSSGSYGSGTWTLAGLAAGASATLTVVAKVTQSGTWTDTAQVVMNGYAPVSANAVATVSSSVSSFNAWTNGTTRTIWTQVASVPPTLTVASLDSGGNLASYTGNVAVSYQYCANVMRTGGVGISCGGSWLDVPGVTTSTATFSGTTTAQVTTPALGDAYEIVRVKLLPASNVPVYASDYFAVRPASLSITAMDRDWQSAGTLNTLNNSSPTQASPVHKAGRPFTVRVSTTTNNYPGTLLSISGLEPVATVGAPASGVGGAFSAGSWSVVSGGGGMQSDSATYAEAGYFDLQLEDRHFSDIDVGDSTPDAQRFVTGSARIGRFVPDHLTTGVIPACGSSFSYGGQPFSVTVSAFAYGALTPMRNYDSAPGFSQNVTLSNAGDTSAMSGNTVAKSLFVGLLGYVTKSGVVYTYPSAAIKTPVSLAIRAVDADNVTSQGFAEASTNIRSGRLWAANAYGSELLDLPVPMQLQYLSSNGWVLNAADNCTALTLPTATSGLNNTLKSKTTASMKYAPAVGGQVGFSLSKPGLGNTGIVDIDMSIVRGGNTWLTLSNPTDRACFGACGPRAPVIFLRERY